MNIFFKKPFLTFLLLAILIDLLSFLGYLILDINLISFFILSLLVLIISFWRLECGIFILLTEIFIGSYGHLFYFNLNQSQISWRMIIFFVVMLVWLIGIIRKKYKINFLHSKIFIFYLLFFIFIIWGIIAGFLFKNIKNLIFLDVNAWFYLLLIFPFFDVINSREKIKNILKVLMASLIWLSIKTFLVFFIFTHKIKVFFFDTYYWIRSHGLGEITAMGSFYRVFFQSQIYCLVGFFIILSFLVYTKKLKKYFYILFIPAIPLLLSFSRTYWLSFVVSLIFFLVIIAVKEKKPTVIGKTLLTILIVFIISFVLIWLSLKVPPYVTVDFEQLLGKRFNLKESAVSSRLIQLPSLLKTILEKPVLGNGFGKTVSYISRDPRALERNQIGLYSTYAFELGYLDIWLKIGLFGLVSFVLLLWKIFKSGWKKINQPIDQSDDLQKPLIVGLLLGLVALITTHFTSPYLNHPLGISYLILCTLIFEYYNQPPKSTT